MNAHFFHVPATLLRKASRSPTGTPTGTPTEGRSRAGSMVDSSCVSAFTPSEYEELEAAVAKINMVHEHTGREAVAFMSGQEGQTAIATFASLAKKETPPAHKGKHWFG